MIKASESLAKLLAMQFGGTGDDRFDGGFRGKYEGPPDHPGGGDMCVNNRTTAYALNALIKLESDVADIWLGRHNRKFVDPLKEHMRTRTWHPLKW